MKKLGLGLVAVVALVVGIGVFLFSWLDGEVLGRETLRRVNRIEGVELEAQDVRLHLFSGLELGNVSATVTFGTGRLTMELESLLLEHDLWSLLRGTLEITGIKIVEPRLSLLWEVTRVAVGRSSATSSRRSKAADRTPAIEEESVAGGDSRLIVEVSTIRIVDGYLLVRTDGAEGEDLEIQGFSVELRDLAFDPALGLPSLVGEGRLRADAIRVGETVAREAVGQISLADGHVRLQSFTFTTPTADLAINDFDADFSIDPFSYDLSIVGEVDLDAVVGAPSSDAMGVAQLSLKAAGEGSETEQMVAQGRLRLADGEIPTPPLIRDLEALLGRPILSGIPYQGTDIRFTVDGSWVALEPFELRGDTVRMGVEGGMSLAGPLDLRIRIRAPVERVEIAGVTRRVLGRLADDEGWLTLPFQVTGTFEQPSVALAWEELEDHAVDVAKEAALDALEELLDKEVGEELGGLLRRLRRRD